MVLVRGFGRALLAICGARALAKSVAVAGCANEAIASHRVEGHGEDKEVASTWPRTIGTTVPDDDADGTFTVDEYGVCVHGRVTTAAFEAGDQDGPWSRPCGHGTS